MWEKFKSWLYDVLTLKTYYIAYIWNDKDGKHFHSWRIIDTNYNLDTIYGLKCFIADYENEEARTDILITFYKRLK